MEAIIQTREFDKATLEVLSIPEQKEHTLRTLNGTGLFPIQSLESVLTKESLLELLEAL